MAAEALRPRLPMPSAKPMMEVDLPSPRGVGVMAVTLMYFPSGRSLEPRQNLGEVHLGYVMAVGK
jgi:hypothetical protein